MDSTIELERYIAAFETWAHVADQGTEIEHTIARVAAYLRGRHRGRVEIEVLCKDATSWLRTQAFPSLDVGKSCLLGRMIYGGEELRTRPCPVHKGMWSGCSPNACAAGCGYGMNITGWLPNDHVEAWPDKLEDEALGAAVRESWSAEHLAIYADHLIALGDLRGELITLELAMRDVATDEQRHRHDWLVAQCFGDLRSVAVDEFRSTRGIGARAAVELGFLAVDARETHDMRKLYDARNGRYLRKLAIRGDAPTCRDTFALISLRPHAWLDRITVVQDPVPKYGRDVTADTARAVFAATPALSALAVTGHHAITVDELPVRWLWMSELESVRFASAPRLTELVLAVPRVDQEFSTVIDDFVRRAPSLEAIHVPATAIAGIASAHPRLRVEPV